MLLIPGGISTVFLASSFYMDRDLGLLRFRLNLAIISVYVPVVSNMPTFSPLIGGVEIVIPRNS